MKHEEVKQNGSDLCYVLGEFEELLNHCESFRLPWEPFDKDRPFQTQSDAPFNKHYGAKWFGNCPTFEDAIHKARYGCPETTEKVLSLSSQLENLDYVNKVVHEQEWRQDVAGAFPLIPAVVAGEPESMIDIVEERTLQDKYGEVVRLYCQVGGHGNWKDHHYLEFGAALTLFIDWLENQNVRVELFAVANLQKVNRKSLKSEHKYFQSKIKIKDPGQPLDLDRVAFVFSEVGFHRRIFFRLQESYDWTRKNLYWTRGLPIDGIPENHGNEHTSMDDGVLLPSMKMLREAGVMDPEKNYASDIRKLVDVMIIAWEDEAIRRL